jgi:anti-anti-sigma regulatory factor
MREDIDPVQWVGQQAVVALPVLMDASNAGQVREELLSVINGGATALIADMTATTSRDHAGADAVVRAFQRAVICGTELRLVVTVHPPVVPADRRGDVPVPPHDQVASDVDLPQARHPLPQPGRRPVP